MCGILGIATGSERRLSIDDDIIVRMRDTLIRRGPDDAGLWRNHHLALAHRRLAIQDPGHGHQPFEIGTPGQNDHFLITYNGELYNHPQLRRELEKRGHRFATNCDTETALRAFAEWGTDAFTRFRGMFALAIYHPQSQTLTLARDPLGIKPLYYAMIPTTEGHELVFASEPVAILDHPCMPRRPDWSTVSAYLTTIRTTLGSRSMYEGISVLQGGEMLRCDLNGDSPTIDVCRWHDPAATIPCTSDFDQATHEAGEVITNSIQAHLLGDVPSCTLLSGGIDSAITSLIASDHIDELRTYCAGAPILGETNDDFSFARLAAEHIGSNHTEVSVRMKDFHDLWPWMIGALGVPLSTPNEVAIYLASQRIAENAKITLSGEGADELFGGYDQSLALAGEFFTQDGLEAEHAAAYYIDVHSWIPTSVKHDVLMPNVMAATDGDAMLHETVAESFRGNLNHESGLQSWLAAQQRFNLSGLLGRLDTATMLASVEGRTPYADVVVQKFARTLPFEYLYHPETTSEQSGGGLATAVQTATTKRILRQAFADRLPQEITNRPKASFPLPFEYWMADHVSLLKSRPLAREIFTEKARQSVIENPAAQWTAAWPMLNLAYWLEINWG